MSPSRTESCVAGVNKCWSSHTRCLHLAKTLTRAFVGAFLADIEKETVETAIPLISAKIAGYPAEITISNNTHRIRGIINQSIKSSFVKGAGAQPQNAPCRRRVTARFVARFNLWLRHDLWPHNASICDPARFVTKSASICDQRYTMILESKLCRGKLVFVFTLIMYTKWYTHM